MSTDQTWRHTYLMIQTCAPRIRVFSNESSHAATDATPERSPRLHHAFSREAWLRTFILPDCAPLWCQFQSDDRETYLCAGEAWIDRTRTPSGTIPSESGSRRGCAERGL